MSSWNLNGQKPVKIAAMTIGIIGAGNIGRAVAAVRLEPGHVVRHHSRTSATTFPLGFLNRETNSL